MMVSNKFVEISLTYNYPDDVEEDEYGNDIEDEDGETSYIYSSGGYGKAIISLVDPELFIVTDNGENPEVSYYIREAIIPNLGPGPHTIGDIQTNEVEDALSSLYSDDVRTSDAYVTMIVRYVDWIDQYRVISVSEKLEELFVSGVSVLELLRIMEIRGIF